MKTWVIGAALALTGCSAGSSQDDVRKMLEANDPMVCASSDVQRTVLGVFSSGYEDFIAAGGKPLEFEMVNSTGLNKDIHEVSCSGTVNLPSVQFDTSTIMPEMAVPITYTVRPSLGTDDEFIVEAETPFRMLPDLIGRYVSKDTTGKTAPVEGTAHQSSANANASPAAVQEFTEAETAMIDSANNAWVEYRNGDDDAEAKFDQYLDRLHKSGICWGERSQSQAEYKFHRCGPNSLQDQPAAAAGSDAAMCNAGDHDACMRL